MKKLLPLLAVAVLMALGGAYLFMHRSVADPTGWKTYKNKTFGISLQYPPNFIVEERTFTSDENALEVSVTDPATRVGYMSVMAWGRQSDIDGASQFFTGPYPKEIPPQGNNSSMTVVERTLNGLKGVERYGFGGEGTSFDDVFMYKNKYLWAVGLDPVREGRQAQEREPGAPVPDKALYDRILASIRISN